MKKSGRSACRVGRRCWVSRDRNDGGSGSIGFLFSALLYAGLLKLTFLETPSFFSLSLAGRRRKHHRRLSIRRRAR